MKKMKKMKRFLAVFDFDQTLVDKDSDRWVFQELNPTFVEKITRLSGQVQWTNLMDECLLELQNQGISIQEIRKAQERIPFDPNVFTLLEWMHQNRGTIIILSDANTFYIETILKHHNCLQFITKIITNPCFMTDKGILRIQRLRDNVICPNGCPVNMCKGQELKFFLELNSFDCIYYFGDGRNDYCPTLLLKESDVVFPRIGYPLHSILKSKESHTSCSIKPWNYISEITQFLQMQESHEEEYHKEVGIWTPLECNPDVLNEFAHKLGMSSPFAFHDVWSLDVDSLSFIPRPCLSLLFLFPITSKYEEFGIQQQESIRELGQLEDPQVFFIKQTIPNACGTIGILHAITNNMQVLELKDGFISDFIAETKSKTPLERAEYLKQSSELTKIHKEFSSLGQSEVPNSNEEVDLHFIAFVERNGQLYELDGRKQGPIHHGPCQDLVVDGARVIQSFIHREPDNVNFSVLAIYPK